jgi:WD40 repeat protein
MDEKSLRAMLADALTGEPPIGPISHRALRLGIRLRRRRRASTASGLVAFAGIAAVLPLTLHSFGVSPAAPAAHAPAIHARSGSMGGKRDIPLRASFSPDGKTLVTSDNDGTARLWSVTNEHQLGQPIVAPGTGVHIRAAVFTANSKTLVTVDTAGTARFWDVATHRQVGAPIAVSSQKLLSVALSPDGKVLAIGGADGSARLYDVATRHQLGAAMTSPGTSVAWVLFSPNGKLLATSDSAGTIRFWSVATHKRVGKAIGAEHGAFVIAVAFSPDSKILAVTGDNLREFSVATSRQIGRTMHPSRFDTNGVVFTSDGKTMISVSPDAQIEEWNVATERKVGGITAAGHVNNFGSVAISPDGKTLATTSFSGAARLWTLGG